MVGFNEMSNYKMIRQRIIHFRDLVTQHNGGISNFEIEINLWKSSIFHCDVSLPECEYIKHLLKSQNDVIISIQAVYVSFWRGSFIIHLFF